MNGQGGSFQKKIKNGGNPKCDRDWIKNWKTNEKELKKNWKRAEKKCPNRKGK